MPAGAAVSERPVWHELLRGLAARNPLRSVSRPAGLQYNRRFAGDGGRRLVATRWAAKSSRTPGALDAFPDDPNLKKVLFMQLMRSAILLAALVLISVTAFMAGPVAAQG